MRLRTYGGDTVRRDVEHRHDALIDEKEIEYVRFSVERIEFDRGDVLTTEGTVGTRKKRRFF